MDTKYIDRMSDHIRDLVIPKMKDDMSPVLKDLHIVLTIKETMDKCVITKYSDQIYMMTSEKIKIYMENN